MVLPRDVSNPQAFTSAAFSPDGTRIVTASYNQSPRVWDAETGALLLVTLRGPEGGFRSAAFSPDGSRIAIANSSDNSAYILDAQTGASLLTLRGHQKGVYFAAFSPDGRRIVTASADGTARIWDASVAILHCQSLIDRARAALPRQLSEEERAREFLDRTPGRGFGLQLLPTGDKCERTRIAAPLFDFAEGDR